MALEDHYRNALIATRATCAKSLAPLAGRLIYDLRTYSDEEGGPILSVELAGELDGEPTGRDKILRLWEEMTRKGIRGWGALMRILERVNPNVRVYLEETAERFRMPVKHGYGSASPVAHQYGFHQAMSLHPGAHEEAGYLPEHLPIPREAAMNLMHNEGMEVEARLMRPPQMAAASPQLMNGDHHLHMPVQLQDPEQESSGALEEEPFQRNSPLSAIGQDARHLLAEALNANKDLVIQIGMELHAPPEVLTQCRRVHNSSGFLFSQLDNATVWDLHHVLQRLRMGELSDRLAQCIY